MMARIEEVYRPVVFGIDEFLELNIAMDALKLGGLDAGLFAARLMARRVLRLQGDALVEKYEAFLRSGELPGVRSFRIGERTIRVERQD
ncbi:hypothetical protein [Methylococcus sp. EFPC2]|uniref:hypothetical protein n=1 Tax=Methylococcus sp. EFPC2 TaxID=2812648 RepID=UPI001967B6A8|nr:hypothetical protein [Methylococcus sp. EFPC2]QSA97120.1 hypothetical protein JWZ97_18330 [Methylococcus sp. EFPC2]